MLSHQRQTKKRYFSPRSQVQIEHQSCLRNYYKWPKYALSFLWTLAFTTSQQLKTIRKQNAHLVVLYQGSWLFIHNQCNTVQGVSTLSTTLALYRHVINWLSPCFENNYKPSVFHDFAMMPFAVTMV